MKRLHLKSIILLLMAIFTGVTFFACNDDDEKKESIQTWTCGDNNSDFYVTMNLYEKTKKIHTIVTYTDTENPTLFGDNVWWKYEYTSDSTITITVLENLGADSNCLIGVSIPFCIDRVSDTEQDWTYFGLHPMYDTGNIIYYYNFKRKE